MRKRKLTIKVKSLEKIINKEIENVLKESVGFSLKQNPLTKGLTRWVSARFQAKGYQNIGQKGADDFTAAALGAEATGQIIGQGAAQMVISKSTQHLIGAKLARRTQAGLRGKKPKKTATTASGEKSEKLVPFDVSAKEISREVDQILTTAAQSGQNAATASVRQSVAAAKTKEGVLDLMNLGVRSADEDLAAAGLKVLDAEDALAIAREMEAETAAALEAALSKLAKGPSGASMTTPKNAKIIQDFFNAREQKVLKDRLLKNKSINMTDPENLVALIDDVATARANSVTTSQVTVGPAVAKLKNAQATGDAAVAAAVNAEQLASNVSKAMNILESNPAAMNQIEITITKIVGAVADDVAIAGRAAGQWEAALTEEIIMKHASKYLQVESKLHKGLIASDDGLRALFVEAQGTGKRAIDVMFVRATKDSLKASAKSVDDAWGKLIRDSGVNIGAARTADDAMLAIAKDTQAIMQSAGVNFVKGTVGGTGSVKGFGKAFVAGFRATVTPQGLASTAGVMFDASKIAGWKSLASLPFKSAVNRVANVMIGSAGRAGLQNPWWFNAVAGTGIISGGVSAGLLAMWLISKGLHWIFPGGDELPADVKAASQQSMTDALEKEVTSDGTGADQIMSLNTNAEQITATLASAQGEALQGAAPEPTIFVKEESEESSFFTNTAFKNVDGGPIALEPQRALKIMKGDRTTAFIVLATWFDNKEQENKRISGWGGNGVFFVYNSREAIPDTQPVPEAPEPGQVDNNIFRFHNLSIGEYANQNALGDDFIKAMKSHFGFSRTWEELDNGKFKLKAVSWRNPPGDE